jgi:NTP pyrophosphatase (non-canonical NTP hydrolase)
MPKSLDELQAEVVAARARWGFAANGLEKLLIGVSSEVGEMVGAIAKEHVWGRPRVPDEDKSSIMHEMADVVVYVMALANLLGIDLEKALESKVRLNDARFKK